MPELPEVEVLARHLAPLLRNQTIRTVEIRRAKVLPCALSDDFTVAFFARALKRAARAIKVKLLDQSLVTGMGNIYASEALFRAGISPRLSARRLTLQQVEHLCRSVLATLADAIQLGSSIPLDWSGASRRDGLFYYGQVHGTPDVYRE